MVFPFAGAALRTPAGIFLPAAGDRWETGGALGVAAGAEVTAKVGAVRLVIRGLAPAWIDSGGRNRGFVGR